METTNYKTYKEMASDLVSRLSEVIEYPVRTEELHNQFYNQDYFIIGYFDAEQWLSKYPGIFNAIEVIKEYEQSNFGEVSTDLSCSEKVCNMFTYIIGEELLNSLKSFKTSRKWTNEDMINDMITELENEYSLKEVQK